MSVVMPPLVADQLALELLNSSPMQQGLPVDYLSNDAQASQWIAHATGMAQDGAARPKGVARQARELRQTIRALVEARLAGRRSEPDALNAWLVQMPSYLQLISQHGLPALQRVQAGRSAMRWLAPFAEAAAQLLSEGDFQLVRQCEHPDCVLWFYDRTKAHKRRWCSMASCGNRHKVSQFRSRQQT